VPPLSGAYDLSADLDREVVLFPARIAARSTERPAEDGQEPIERGASQVAVIEVAGRLGAVVDDLDRAIQMALADGPRGVVCDLSGVPEGAEPDAVGVLATAGRHVRDWPAVPVVVACPDPQVRAALAAHPLGCHLLVTPSVPIATSAVLATPTPVVEWLRLAPQPTAPRAARIFVTRTLMDWGLSPLVTSACLVASELVISSTIFAGTDIDLCISWHLDALRLTVRDNSADLPRQHYSQQAMRGRGVSAAADLSRAFGVLPTTDGGKVVWSVLNAVRPRPLAGP
jgi:hypothetical protein